MLAVAAATGVTPQVLKPEPTLTVNLHVGFGPRQQSTNARLTLWISYVDLLRLVLGEALATVRFA